MAGAAQAMKKELWPGVRGVAVGQRQPFAGAESACDDTHTLRRMSAQLGLEAGPWAAVLRSCPDTRPWAQMPTLAPELLCHPFNLTGGHRLHSQMPPKGQLWSHWAGGTHVQREAGIHQDFYPLLLPPSQQGTDYPPTTTLAAGRARGPRTRGSAWLGLSHGATRQGGCAGGVSCYVSVLPLPSE